MYLQERLGLAGLGPPLSDLLLEYLRQPRGEITLQRLTLAARCCQVAAHAVLSRLRHLPVFGSETSACILQHAGEPCWYSIDGWYFAAGSNLKANRDFLKSCLPMVHVIFFFAILSLSTASCALPTPVHRKKGRNRLQTRRRRKWLHTRWCDNPGVGTSPRICLTH